MSKCFSLSRFIFDVNKILSKVTAHQNIMQSMHNRVIQSILGQAVQKCIPDRLFLICQKFSLAARPTRTQTMETHSACSFILLIYTS